MSSKPPGRLPITSSVYGPGDRAAVDRAISETIAHKEQVYVITPLIEESDSLGVRAATTEHERLTELLPHARVGLLHGAMPGVERVAVLNQFRNHELGVIVSTTVIEVGVDVPNATLIVIEGAERFGLAQLHQLRGRVGRGLIPSRCFFVTDKQDDRINQRLSQVAATTDGFAISELDLQERGAGDMYGQRQSGLPSWKLASLNDRQLFERVKTFVDSLSDLEQRRLVTQFEATENTPGSFHPE